MCICLDCRNVSWRHSTPDWPRRHHLSPSNRITSRKSWEKVREGGVRTGEISPKQGREKQQREVEASWTETLLNHLLGIDAYSYSKCQPIQTLKCLSFSSAKDKATNTIIFPDILEALSLYNPLLYITHFFAKPGCAVQTNSILNLNATFVSFCHLLLVLFSCVTLDKKHLLRESMQIYIY